MSRGFTYKGLRIDAPLTIVWLLFPKNDFTDVTMSEGIST